MVQAASQAMKLEEFLDWYPDGYGRYELWNGVVVPTQPTGIHEQVSGFLAGELFIESGAQGCLISCPGRPSSNL